MGEGAAHVAQLVVGGTVRGDLDQGEPVPVALGLGERDLVRGDGERVGAFNAALDLDVVNEAALIGGLDVVACLQL